jgi:hypothetical protein
MGFLDEWSRRASQRREGKVDFLGEQSGIVEETLKRELILEFATRPDIQRAYLASVSFPPATDPSSALCVVSRRPDDRSLILRVAEIFRRRFSREPTLDIIFLTAEQESELAALCAPFYGRPIAS